MPLTTIQKDKLQDIADAIRQRKGTSNTMTPGQMPEEILNIPGGSSPSQSKSVTYSSNDTYIVYPDPGYLLSSVETTVAVPAPVVDTVSASYTANGNYEITPSSGHLMDRALVTVNVPGGSPSQTKLGYYTENGYYYINPDPGYLLSSAEVQVNVPQTPVQTKSQTIDTNGSYTVYPDTGYNLEAVNLTVAVPSSGKPEQTKTVAYNYPGEYTITPDTGYTLGQVDVTVYNNALHGSVSRNGTFTFGYDGGPVYSEFILTVDVPAPTTQAKTETYTTNGTYTISPDSGYDYLTGATITVNVPTTGTSDFAKHRFQTSSGGTASWTMDAMTVGESRIQDLVFYYPTMQVTANYKTYLPSAGTYSVQSWGSSTVETKNGGDLFESHTWSYNSSKSGDIGAATTWVVTRLT